MATNPDPWAEFGMKPAAAPKPASPRPVYGAPKLPTPVTAPQAQDMNINAAEEERKRLEWNASHNPDGTPKGTNPDERRARIKVALENLADLEKMVKDNSGVGSIEGQEGFRSGDSLKGLSRFFNQDANNVAGAIEMVQGDLINQVRLEMQDSGAPVGVKGADTEKEASRLAASIANLAQTQDDAQFLIGVTRAREYYQRRLAGLDETAGTAATPEKDDDDPAALKVNVPAMSRDIPTGSDTEMGAGLRDDTFDVEGWYQDEYGISRNQAAQVEAVLNANLNNRGITAQDLAATFEGLGVPTGKIDLDDAAAKINAGDFVGDPPRLSPFRFDWQSAKERREVELDNEIGRRGIDPETTGRAALGHGLQGTSLGAGDEISGVVAGVGALAQGENPIEAYKDERDLTRRKLERSAEYAPKTAFVSELAGGLATGPLGFRKAGVAASEAALARTAAKETGTYAAEAAAKAASRNAVVQMGRSGATVGGVAGVNYGEGTADSLIGGVVGGVTGGVAGSALQAASPLVGKFFNRKGNAVDGADDVVAAGKEFDVPVMTTDVLPPQSSIGKKVKQSFPEAIPLAGTGGPRAAQQEARTEAAKTLLKEHGGNPEFNPFSDATRAVDDVAKNLSETRLAEIKRLKMQKDSVIDGAQGVVQAPQALAALDKEIARVSRLPGMEGVVQKLQGWRQALSEGRSLREVEDIRKIMGEAFQGENLGDIRGIGQKAVNAIYGPLRSDMGVFIKENAGKAAFTGWKNANEKLAAMAGQLESQVFRSVLRDAETTPENVAKMMFSAKPSDVKRLYEGLGEEGRRRMQAGLLQEAFNRSIRADAGFSVDAFVGNLEKLGTPIGVAFKKADAERIQGFVRLIRSTKRASAAAASPPTGAQNTPIALGYGIGTLFGTAALPVTAAVGMLARAYESAPVRNMLLRLARTKEGSPQEKTVISQITKLLSVGSERAAVNDNIGVAAAASETEEQ